MPAFKDDGIIIIAPGSSTTLAQLGLPESFTPARLRVRSRMFPAEKEGEWEPYKVRRKGAENGAEPEPGSNGVNGDEEEPVFEEDFVTEEGATWPVQDGSIVDWPCFFALLTHVYNQLSPPFHTPILLISEPAWTLRDHEKITQFFFEKFRPPGFAMMDSAQAACWAYGVHTATVIDIGLSKADITAVSEYVTHDTGRTIALKNCGGEAMTQRLLELLASKGLSREMCEQLKKNPICELLPPGIPLPGSGEQPKEPANPAAAASTGVDESGPDARDKAQEAGVPRGPGPDTEVGEEQDEGEKEGVLDVASIVAGGKMNEYLAQKEKEKNEKLAARKKGSAADAAAAAKPTKLANSKRQKATFMYEDHALLDTLKGMNLTTEEMANAHAGLDEGVKRAAPDSVAAEGMATAGGEVQPAGTTQANGVSGRQSGSIRREIEVGTERFQAASGGILDRIADAVHRTICRVEEVNKRSELWDSLIIVGNGARIRGFRESLMATLQSKYIISPSSATMFTSEIPSNVSTPAATGANTPVPQLGPHGGSSQPSGVNPLLLAATTAQTQHLQPPGMSTPGGPGSMHGHSNQHSSHGQTPSSIKFAKTPEYFPEWKEVGWDEAHFLGAQVAAKVLFIVDQGLSKGYMTRPDYNEQGPSGIHDFVLQ